MSCARTAAQRQHDCYHALLASARAIWSAWNAGRYGDSRLEDVPEMEALREALRRCGETDARLRAPPESWWTAGLPHHTHEHSQEGSHS